MKLSWDYCQEISIRAMLYCGANGLVISQSFTDILKAPGILRSHAYGVTMANGSKSATNAVGLCTHTCTGRCGNHFSRESLEISPLQSAHETLLPWG